MLLHCGDGGRLGHDLCEASGHGLQVAQPVPLGQLRLAAGHCQSHPGMLKHGVNVGAVGELHAGGAEPSKQLDDVLVVGRAEPLGGTQPRDEREKGLHKLHPSAGDFRRDGGQREYPEG